MGIARRQQHVERARDVVLVRGQRVVYAARHRRQRRLMEHGVRPGEDRPERVSVGNTDLIKLKISVQVRQVLAPAGGQIVHDAHAMPVVEQPLDQVRADEARAARDNVGLCHAAPIAGSR